jgi:cytoskeletal protein CcmA (bactofilin family)
MALKSFGRGGSLDIPGQALSPPPAAGSTGSGGSGGLTAFIDQGSEFEGKLSFRDTVRIDGRFRGEIASENTLIVGESGEIEATIRSNSIAISGTVVGNVHAAQRVVLHKTARVDGDVETPSLMMEDGAVLNGQVKMNAPAAKPATGSATEASKSLKAIEGGAPRPDEAPPKK